MANNLARQFGGCCSKFRISAVYGRSSGIIPKRNLSEFKQQLKDIEKHAEETYLTWKNISLFVALPVCSYMFYKHIIVGEHIEEPKEFVGYDHIRMRKKPFPWGDGDKSLFHNEKYNVGPDTDFEAEEEHGHGHEEPLMTRLIRHFMPKREDLIKARDEHLVHASIVAVENLEILSQPALPPVPGDIFGVQERMRKPRAYNVDD